MVACCLFARRIFMLVPAVGGAGSQPARYPAETGVGCPGTVASRRPLARAQRETTRLDDCQQRMG